MPQNLSSAVPDLNAVRAFIREANRMIAEGRNEDAIRSNLVSHFRLMFPGAPPWISEHIKGGETALKFHKENRAKTVTGFVDNLVGLTVIEYEKDLTNPKLFAEGYNQVREYSAGLLNQHHPADQVIGILSDSVRWHAYEIESVAIKPGTLSGSDVVLKEIGIGVNAADAGPLAAEQLAQFMVQHLQRLGSRPLSATSIGYDLGFGSEFCRSRLSGLDAVVNSAFSERPDYAKLVAKLWVNFVSYVRAKDAEGFDRADYVRELYILTLGKLICANALLKRAAISDDNELSDILSGAFFQRYGLLNFVEYDYFGWLNSESEYRNKLIPVARDMQRDLLAYDFNRPSEEDIFGTLMSQLASASQRLLLGQEWTPSWLAGKMVQELLSQLAPGEAPRFIDMCSGSGSMMVEVVKRAKPLIEAMLPAEATLQEKASRLAQAVTGFDIDPLAVMLSKISWVLAARDWLGTPGTVQVAIPAYHADTLFAMTPLSNALHKGKDHITLEMEEHGVRMPRFLVSSEWQPMFDAIIEKAYELSHGEGCALLAPSEMLDVTGRIASECGLENSDPRIKEVSQFLQDLTAAIWQLSRDRRNGIWSFIIRNSYRPGLVSGQFNGLVSNPPWLTLSKMSANPYGQALKAIAKSLGLEPPGAASIHLELAVVFLLHAVLHYLRPGAVVGCVMPETVFNGHHLQPFRIGKYSTAPMPVPFTVTSLWQVDEGTFKNRAAVVFGTKKTRPGGYLAPHPVTSVSRDKPDVSGILNVSVLGKMVVWAEGKSIIVPTPYNPATFRQGADVMPRTVFFHQAEIFDGKASLTKISRGSDSWFMIAQPKKCKDFALPSPCVLPQSFLQKVFTSTMMAPFIISEPRDALLPIKRLPSGAWGPISASDMAKFAGSLGVNAKNTFKRIGEAIAESKNAARPSDPIQYIWSHIETNMRKASSQVELPASGYLVMFGAGGGNICAAHIALQGKDELVKRLLVDQTMYWTHVSSEDEALYLTGALNTSIVNQIITVFQPKGLADERHVHKLALGVTPPFDAQKPVHVRLASKTKELISEFYAVLSEMRADPKRRKQAEALCNPNNGLGSRRDKVRGILEALPAYASYEAAGVALYVQDEPEALAAA